TGQHDYKPVQCADDGGDRDEGDRAGGVIDRWFVQPHGAPSCRIGALKHSLFAAFRGTRPMLLPVIDLMQGEVVHGIAGRREEYRPIVSILAESTKPLAVARAFREEFGFNELYLADLDAI